MGSGNWSKQFYDDQRAQEASTGTNPFAYHQVSSAKKATTGRHEIHPMLDVFGPKTREACDSPEHPHSRPIAVLIDQTGSMSTLPRTFLDNLGTLYGLLLKNGVSDPQVCFGAIGDARNNEDVPVQVSQFESDNRMDECLKNIVLEGNGGGQRRESYELLMYYFNHHTKLDCWGRGERGYLFILGDEMPWEQLSPADVEQHIGGHPATVSTETLVADLQKKYDVYFVVPKSISNYAGDVEISSRWAKLIGADHVLPIEEPKAIASLIATTVALAEGVSDIDQAVTNMKAAGVSAAIVKAVSQTVDPLARKSAGMARVAAGGLAAATAPAVARL
jgi:hypothetical protein